MIYTVYTVLYICLFAYFKLHCFVRTFVFISYSLHLHILYKIVVQSYLFLQKIYTLDYLPYL